MAGEGDKKLAPPPFMFNRDSDFDNCFFNAINLEFAVILVFSSKRLGELTVFVWSKFAKLLKNAETGRDLFWILGFFSFFLVLSRGFAEAGGGSGGVM